MDEDVLTPEEQTLLGSIQARRAKLVADHRRRKGVANNSSTAPRRLDTARTSTTANMRVRANSRHVEVMLPDNGYSHQDDFSLPHMSHT